jgi:general stress protein 26
MQIANGDIQSPDHRKAIDKMKAVIKHNSICLFTSNLAELPLHARPMSTSKVCDQGNFWFLSSRDSDENEEIALDPRVQLFFANPSDLEYLTVYGMASISNDLSKIEELWTPQAKAWFAKGSTDPGITVIKVKPEEVFCWDNKNEKMVSLLIAIPTPVLSINR